MFYSHQLLARKAPLGQIWMAATMHAKINRKKLDKLDLIQICEEILNPSVPMALRLSSILMGGVVIVFERKVKLLYDDVTRFLVDINEAWKVKPVADPTVLPKGKSQAKFEAVTLPEDVEVEEMEQALRYSDSTFAAAKFQSMRLEDLDECYINIDIRDDDLSNQHHQAEAANITLFDDYGSSLANNDPFNRFERFDIEEDDETHINFASREQPQVPTMLRPSVTPQDGNERAENGFIPSPPLQPELPQADDRPQDQREEKPSKQPLKRKGRGQLKHLIMDNDQLMIPGNIYQTWLQNTSNIVTKRGRTVKECLRSFNPVVSTKISNLMELPPVALISGVDISSVKLHYPDQLMELWRNCTSVKSENASPSSGNDLDPDQQREPCSPAEGLHRNAPEIPPEEFQGERGSNPLEFSIEKLRANLENMDFQGVDDTFSSDHYVTPGNSGRSSKSFTSSGSGHGFMPFEPEMSLLSGRSNKRRQHSSSKTNMGNLDPVEEEFPLQQGIRDFKIRRLSEDGPTPDLEILEETEPTQTLHHVQANPSVDKITQSIRTHLKLHFDTPGNPQSESLNQLAFGMNQKRAAQLFYQTCVLATLNFIKVEQTEAYGDILISPGPKM